MSERKDIKKAALADRQGTFHLSGTKDKIQGETEYALTYEADKIIGDHRVQPIKPVVQSSIAGPKVRLEGESEVKAAYKKPAEISPNGLHVYDKVKDFKPVFAGNNAKEDRNFVSVTKDAFQPHQCPASQLHHLERNPADGHLYVAESEHTGLPGQ